MKEQYGKLSLENLEDINKFIKDLIDILPFFRNMTHKNAGKLVEDIDARLNWSIFYSLPFLDHLSLLISSLDLNDDLKYAAKQSDPTSCLLSLWRNKRVEDWDDKSDGYGSYFSKGSAVALAISFLKSFESIFVFGKPLNRLLSDLHDGDNKALRKILRIDHSAVLNPEIAWRLMSAELEHDIPVFNQIGNALKERDQSKNKKSNKKDLEYRELRFFLALLQESGGLDKLSEEQCYQLFCLQLKVFPDDGADPAGSLKRYITRWKKMIRT